MTIVVTGGGSGGHITPLLAVAAELKKQQKPVNIIYIGQRGDRFAKVVAESQYIDESKYIFAGKLRRYHGEGWKQLLDIKTMLLNLRDIFLVLLGCLQGLWLLGRIRPSVVFIKGGFVGVPVGLSAAVWRIPYITHDSDALAGLANRLIARWASLHAVALPAKIYAYPQDKTVTVGVPIASEYAFVDAPQQTTFKKALGINPEEQLLFITGGGLGAKVINDAVTSISARLLSEYPTFRIIHGTGHAHKEEIAAAYKKLLPDSDSGRVIVEDYIKDMHQYSGAADIVIARAGATNMAELAAQGKACIIVPNPVLAGGHQLKNAQAYTDANAAVLVDQADLAGNSEVLYEAVSRLLDTPQERTRIAGRLHAFAVPDAAQKLAQILIGQAEKEGKEARHSGV